MKWRVSPRAWSLIAAGVPCAIAIWINVWFVWNHFVEGPYLHDSGWYSAIVWRAGVLPKNPLSVHFIRDYYGIHVSPLVSVGSLLSYLAPIGRVRWYCVFQAAIFAPLGAVVAMLVPAAERTSMLRDALAVGAVATVFALNGQVLWCVGFPHFEIFVSSGVCIMLSGVATGRLRLAWIGLVCTAATREDGGFHAASFLAAAIACDVLGRPFPIARRRLLTMLAVAAGASVVAFFVQKTFFTSANLFRHEYLGEPPFAHLSGAELVRRGGAFFTKATVVSFPLVATVIVAVARRDARYLLGYAAELPWLLLNLLAAQELKTSFGLYTGFPFVGSIFWAAAYARVGDRGARGRGWLGGVTIVSLLATLGAWFANPVGFRMLVHDAVWPTSTPSRGIEAFAAALNADPDAYGRLYLDQGVTSWAIDKTSERERVFHTQLVTTFEGVDGAAFYVNGRWGSRLFWFLGRSPFTKCGRISDTSVYFCGREERPLPPMFVPASVVNGALLAGTGARKDGERFVVDARREGLVAVFGPFTDLPKGRYVARWRFEWGACIDGASPPVADVSSNLGVAASRPLRHDAEVEVPFELAKDAQRVELRTWSGECAYVVDRVTLTPESPLPPEPAP